jgi:hypothetical protein
MELADRLREAADRLPAAPPGDPAATFRRGRRRRQRRHAGIAASAAAGVIAIAVVGLSLLPSGGPADLEVADQPGGDPAAIIGPPAVLLSSAEPFEWAVAISPGTGGRWCFTTTSESTVVGDTTGQPCDQVIDPENTEPPLFGTGAAEVIVNQSGTRRQSLSWGLAPPETDEVMVLFADGTRAITELAGETTSDGRTFEGRLWAIGYLGAEVIAVEARADGEALSEPIPDTTAPAAGATTSPQDAFGELLVRAQLEQFTDEAPALLDLRAADELYSLDLRDDWRSIGIRVREGSAPLMWATDCDVLASQPLPEGWIGVCRTYTDPEAGQVWGLFPHGTISATADPRNLDADPELTERFIEAFAACLIEQGINVDHVDAIVTEDRELQMLGWASSGEEPPGSESADMDCENALMEELQLRPYLG